MMETPPPANWMRNVLKLAALYNIVWGAWVILFPELSLRVGGFEDPARYPQLWQCIGMIVGVYGVGYWIAAGDPYRHWLIVLVGFLGKVFGPLGMLAAIFQGDLPATAFITNITNDLIWWIPFAIILWRAIRYEQNKDALTAPAVDFEKALRDVVDQHGKSLRELSRERSLLVLFVRHAGCTFCREALADLEQQRDQIEKAGHHLAVVHMGTDESAQAFFKKYHLSDISRFSDPQQLLYRAFELELGNPSQLFGLRIWWRGFKSAILSGHGFGGLVGNGFRMPGMFIIKDGKILASHKHKDASERPDYVQFSQCTV